MLFFNLNINQHGLKFSSTGYFTLWFADAFHSKRGIRKSCRKRRERKAGSVQRWNVIFAIFLPFRSEKTESANSSQSPPGIKPAPGRCVHIVKVCGSMRLPRGTGQDGPTFVSSCWNRVEAGLNSFGTEKTSSVDR